MYQIEYLKDLRVWTVYSYNWDLIDAYPLVTQLCHEVGMKVYRVRLTATT